MSKLKGLIIGAGYFSEFHLEAWKKMPRVEILAIADQHQEKAEEKAVQFGIKHFYSDIDNMLASHQFDFVDIITPPSSHLALISKVSQSDAAIICQKPLAENYTASTSIATLLEERKNPFMVHENWRFQPWYREMKKIILSGILGKNIIHLSAKMRLGDGWQENAYLDRQPYFRNMKRLLMHETGIHFIDTFRFLAGEIASVTAQLQTLNPLIQGEDKALVMIEFANGASAILDADRYHEPFHENPRYTFGTMLIEMDQGSMELLPDGNIRVKPLGKELYLHPYRPSKEGFAGDCVYNCQKHFIEQLTTGGEFETNIKDYLKSIEVVESVYTSHENEQKILLGKTLN